MDQIINALTSLTPLVCVLVALGLVTKYVPVKIIAAIPNAIIPFLNAAIAFFTAFGPTPAHAGIFGDIFHTISGPAKIIGSLAISAIASSVYEVFLRHPLERFGARKATP